MHDKIYEQCIHIHTYDTNTFHDQQEKVAAGNHIKVNILGTF